MGEFIKTVFYCRSCNEVAGNAEFELAPDGGGQLNLTGFLWGSSSQGIASSQGPELLKVLQRRSASALYQLDSLWAPFYCPQCQASYCHRHWEIARVYDDDFPGWYDSSYGVCPAGHRRLVDD